MGMYSKRARSGPLTAGMVAGVIMAILVQTNALASSEDLPKISAGVLGFATNLFVVACGHFYLYKIKGETFESEMETVTPSFRFKNAIPSHLIGFYVTPSKEELADPILRQQARADGHKEPIQNPSRTIHESIPLFYGRESSTLIYELDCLFICIIVPIAAFILLVLSSPVILQEGQDGVTNGLPTWAVLSIQVCVISSLVMVYSLYWSWDLDHPDVVRARTKSKDLEAVDIPLSPKLKRRNLSTQSHESARDIPEGVAA